MIKLFLIATFSLIGLIIVPNVSATNCMTGLSDECLVELPEIKDFGPEKDTDTNNETVAGNEQVADPEQESASAGTVNQAPVVAQSNVSTNQAATTENNTEGQSPEVLSESTEEKSETPGKVTIPESNINDNKPIQAVNNSKVYLYYLLAGVIAFIALVTFLLMAMKKQKK